MPWRKLYQHIISTPEEAISRIPNTGRIFIGSGCAEPQVLVDALSQQAGRFESVEIVSLLTVGRVDFVQERFAGHFRHNAFFVGDNTRKAVNEGRADFTPIFLSEIPALFHARQYPLAAAMIQVSPPDVHGYCSLGISVDIVKAAVEAADLVIAEINPRMPRVLGDSFIHISQIGAAVPVDTPVLTLQREPCTDVHKAIGAHVADLVEDGATLQMGIGCIPDAVLGFLNGKKDLGIHTEMFSDGVMELYEKGVITGARKTLHKRKIVTSFLMGSTELYHFVDNNPFIECHPSDYVNDPFVVAKNHRMTAINSALQVDITGQVCADSIGQRIYSGIGGQVDFIRGAARAPGGKPIIALPATAKNGQVSRITPVLDPGAGVVTSRGDVHYVATEYGVANLHGKNLSQRARELIAIAAPQFRDELTAAARARKLL